MIRWILEVTHKERKKKNAKLGELLGFDCDGLDILSTMETDGINQRGLLKKIYQEGIKEDMNSFSESHFPKRMHTAYQLVLFCFC